MIEFVSGKESSSYQVSKKERNFGEGQFEFKKGY